MSGLRDARDFCATCGRKLTEDERVDCGGDCVFCLAAAGDPDAITYIAQEARE